MPSFEVQVDDVQESERHAPLRGQVVRSISSERQEGEDENDEEVPRSRRHFNELLLRMTRVALTVIAQEEAKNVYVTGSEEEQKKDQDERAEVKPLEDRRHHSTVSPTRTSLPVVVYQELANFFTVAAALKKRQMEFRMLPWELRVITRVVFRELYLAALPLFQGDQPARQTSWSTKGRMASSHATATLGTITTGKMRTDQKRRNEEKEEEDEATTEPVRLCRSVGNFMVCAPVWSLTALRSALREEQQKEVRRCENISTSEGEEERVGKPQKKRQDHRDERGDNERVLFAGPPPTLLSPPPLTHCFAEVMALSQALEKRVFVAMRDEEKQQQKEKKSEKAVPFTGETKSGGSSSSFHLFCERCASSLLPVQGPHAVRLSSFFSVVVTLWPVVYLSDILRDVIEIWQEEEEEEKLFKKVGREKKKSDKEEEEEENKVEQEAGARGEVALLCLATMLWCWSVLDSGRAQALRSFSQALLLHPSRSSSLWKASHASSLPLSVSALQDVLEDVMQHGERHEAYAFLWGSSSYPDPRLAAENTSCRRASALFWYQDRELREKEKDVTPSEKDQRNASHLERPSLSSLPVKAAGGLARPAASVLDRGAKWRVKQEEVAEEKEKSWMESKRPSSRSSSSSSSLIGQGDEKIDYEFWGALASTPPSFSSPVIIAKRQ